MSSEGVAYKPPTRWDRLGELRAGREGFRLALQSRRLKDAPNGDGRTSILMPGYGTSDSVMVPLRLFLRKLDHDARGWGLGVNTGDVQTFLDRAMPGVVRAAEKSGRPINLVGWSLGGVVAREVARDAPDLVRQVITFGTPLTGPRYTSAAAAYGEERILEIEAQIAERRDRLIQVPVTAVYSQFDGIVDWRTCVDHETPGVENIQVSSSHIGMGIDPDIWRLIAQKLAE